MLGEALRKAGIVIGALGTFHYVMTSSVLWPLWLFVGAVFWAFGVGIELRRSDP